MKTQFCQNFNQIEGFKKETERLRARPMGMKGLLHVLHVREYIGQSGCFRPVRSLYASDHHAESTISSVSAFYSHLCRFMSHVNHPWRNRGPGTCGITLSSNNGLEVTHNHQKSSNLKINDPTLSTPSFLQEETCNSSTMDASDRSTEGSVQ